MKIEAKTRESTVLYFPKSTNSSNPKHREESFSKKCHESFLPNNLKSIIMNDIAQPKLLMHFSINSKSQDLTNYQHAIKIDQLVPT